MAKIAFCAGHGFNTAGKRTPDGEREWSFNNQTALAFEEAMKQYENVELLRTDDRTGKVDVTINSRVKKANEWKADVYVSFHKNALAGKWGTHTGTEVFNWGEGNSLKLAKLVNPKVVQAYGLRDRGVKLGKHLGIIARTLMPAILIEGGFMDSTIDIKKLRDGAVLRAEGYGVAEAVAQYFGLRKKPAPKPVVPKPTPAPAAKTSGDVMYRVVTGSFSNRLNAGNQVGLLEHSGFKSFILPHEGMFRVVTGSFSDRNNAEKRIEELKRHKFSSFIAIYKK
jgi:N-acetylmuramoyl-L-alanine amidase